MYYYLVEYWDSDSQKVVTESGMTSGETYGAAADKVVELYDLENIISIELTKLEDILYEEEHIELEAGTRIVAYTDGVTEAENDRLELYGEERLVDSIGQLEADADEKTVVEQLYQSVKAFTAGHPQSDDITIMSLSV